MEWKSLLLCILLIGFFMVGAAAVSYYQKIVEINWVVVESEGLEVSCKGIMFGSIEQGKNKTAEFWVKNVAETQLNVSITWIQTLGGIGIVVEPQNFILDVNQKETVAVTIAVSEITELGGHDNELIITAYPLQ